MQCELKRERRAWAAVDYKKKKKKKKGGVYSPRQREQCHFYLLPARTVAAAATKVTVAKRIFIVLETIKDKHQYIHKNTKYIHA